MSKLYRKILKFLPIFIIVSVLLMPTPANAGLLSWAKGVWDDATEIGKSVIDTVKSCTGGVAACKKAAKDNAKHLAEKALGLTPGKDCPVPVEDSPCMFCPMFKILYMASSGVAKASYDAFHSDLGKLILIFLAVSLALIVLKNVASMGARDPGSVLNDVFTKAFVCVAIYIIVTQDYFMVLNATIAPMIKDALNFVSIGDGVDAADHMMNCMRTYTPTGFSMTMGAMNGAVLPTDIGNTIYCAIDNIEQKIHKLFSFGQYAFCLGTGPKKIFLVLPHPVYIIDGLFLYIGGLFFLVAYPWVMADAVLQMGIAFAFLPFAITGYAFSGTKKYLNKTFQWILHSLFVFVFMAILINCVLGYVAKLLGLIMSTTGNSDVLFTDPNQGIAFYGPNMIKIIFILAIGWVYMPTIRDLAGKFSSGSPLSAASKVGGEVTGMMEKNFNKVADVATGMAVQGASATARGAVRLGRNQIRRTIMNVTQKHGHDDGFGNQTFTIGGRSAPKWLTRGLEFKVERDADGNEVLRREFTSVTGRKHVMLSDQYSTIKQEYTASGNQIKNKVKFKSSFIRKHLMNAKGEVNVGALQAVLNSPLGKNPAYRQAIMEQLSMEVLKSKGKKVGTYYKSRNVTFNPADPTKITIEQIDHSGRTTKFSLDINEKTGQAGVSYATTTGKSKKDYEIYFNNGMVEMQTKGKRDGGTILYETTKFNYSPTAQKGHDSILEADDTNQVVDKFGVIASDLQQTIGTPPKDNPNYLLHGMESIVGVTSIGTQSMDDFVLHNILQRGRVNETNKFNTNIGNYFI